MPMTAYPMLKLPGIQPPFCWFSAIEHCLFIVSFSLYAIVVLFWPVQFFLFTQILSMKTEPLQLEHVWLMILNLLKLIAGKMKYIYKQIDKYKEK